MPRKRVLFLCIGNSCRSQMAEGFARAYGKDVIEPSSAGLAPAYAVSPLTIEVMKAKNIDLSEAVPKGLLETGSSAPAELVVNMSGRKLPVGPGVQVEEWQVRDPIGESKQVFEEVAAKVESLVMALVLRLRQQQQAAGPASPPRTGFGMRREFDSRRGHPGK